MTWINNGDTGLSVRTKLNTIPNDGTNCTALFTGGALGTPSSGTLTNCTGLPVAGVIGAVASGGALGTPSSGTLTNCVGLPLTTGVTGVLPVANMATMTATVGGAVPTPPNNTTTFLRGDGTFAAPAGGGITINSSTITGGTTTRLLYDNGGTVGEITGATSNGTALTLVAPVLGTPASGTLTNCTGLPAAGVVGTALVVGGALGTPASGTLTNCTGLPAAGVVGTAAVLGANTFTGAQTAPAFIATSANVNAQTGTSYTLLSGDNGLVVTLSNAGAITLTVPSGLGAGFACTLVQLAAGQVAVTASSTTINSNGTLTHLKGQYAVASLYAYAADTFALAGNLA